jgi:hypothetical protein
MQAISLTFATGAFLLGVLSLAIAVQHPALPRWAWTVIEHSPLGATRDDG